MKIIDFNEARERRQKVNLKDNGKYKRHSNEKLNESTYNKDSFSDDFDVLANTSYYYSIDGVEVRFGGAFVRSLIENIEKNKTRILKTIEVSNDGSKYHVSQLMRKDDEMYEFIMMTIENQGVLMNEIINNVKTPYDLDEVFQDDSEYLTVIGLVLTIVMAHSYSNFDYHRMVRDNWLQLSIPIDDFMNSELYSEILKSGRQ